jgi:hypothetical protein
MGKEMFIMQRIGKHEITPNVEGMQCMHTTKCMLVTKCRWNGGLKRKWRRLMKRFDSTKPKYSHLFKSRTLLNNFLHRRRMNLTYEVNNDHFSNLEDHGWAGDF